MPDFTNVGPETNPSDIKYSHEQRREAAPDVKDAPKKPRVAENKVEKAWDEKNAIDGKLLERSRFMDEQVTPKGKKFDETQRSKIEKEKPI